MKSLILAAILAVLSLPVSAEWSIDDRNKLVDDTNFVVGDGCSGTLISVEHRLILTAYHCIAREVRTRTFDEVGADGVMMKVTRQELMPVRVAQYRYNGHTLVGAAEFVTEIVAYQQSRDLALLQFKAPTIPFTAASPLLPEGETVQRSEIVWLVGNPLMLDASISMGTVSSVTRTFAFSWTLQQPVPLIQFDAAGEPGSSGGSLYNDRGQLIGVTIAKGGAQMLAVPIEAIREFIRANGWGVLLGDAVPAAACC